MEANARDYVMPLATLPSTAWDIIIQDLSYNDVRVLLNTPVIRDMILDHISYETNLRQFKKKTILDCIDKFEQDLNTDLFLENIDYFVKNGYVEIYKLSIHDKMISKFYIELEGKCSFVPDSLKLLIQNFKQRNIDPEELLIMNFTEYELSNEALKKFMDILNHTANEHYEKLGEIEEQNIDEFVQELFEGPKGLENVLRYLLELEKYIDEYLKDNIHAKIFKNTLCKRLKNVVCLFEK
jgi:hypothetical protein